MATVVGLFRTESAAERAISDLKAAGYEASQIGVVAQNRDTSKTMAAANDVTDAGTVAGAGAVEGTVVGGALAALIATGTILTLPILGPIALAGSALAWTAAGAGIGAATGAVAGGLLGSLTNAGVPSEEAQYYQAAVGEGSILLTVDPQGQDEAATRRILLDAGAEDVQNRMGSSPALTASNAGIGSTTSGRMTAVSPTMVASDALSGGVYPASEIEAGNNSTANYFDAHDPALRDQEAAYAAASDAAMGNAGLAGSEGGGDYAKTTTGSQYAATTSYAASESLRTDQPDAASAVGDAVNQAGGYIDNSNAPARAAADPNQVSSKDADGATRDTFGNIER